MNLNNNKFSEFIKLQAKTNSLAHAYLIFGDVSVQPLIDIYKIQPADIFAISETPIKINHIRELVHWLQLKPHSSLKKIVILPQIETMTQEAANSLLKILEEPPSYVILILQAYKKEKILPTVISRCQIIREGDALNDSVPPDYLSSKKIGKMTILERFNYVSSIITQENLNRFIDLWEEEIRLDLLGGNDKSEVLKYLSRTRRLLLTNTSVKLLLENLLLKF